jgi:hypothetical protein
MERMIERITPAILDSRKVRVSMGDGNGLVVRPHIVIRKKHGSEILKCMLDNGSCMDIPLGEIRNVSILTEGFAVDSQCLSYDYEEYELVFPKREDWFVFKKDVV